MQAGSSTPCRCHRIDKRPAGLSLAAMSSTSSEKTSPAKARRGRSLKPTMAMVAKAARCSLMTVSYALRDHPKISKPTRLRVQKAAADLGYKPDPEIARLMHLLRTNRTVEHQSNIAILSLGPSEHSGPAPFVSGLVLGIKRRAKELGYTVDDLRVNPSSMTPSRVTSMLLARGIKGIIVPPLPSILDCRALLDWSQFSVVAATYSAQGLPVNRVVPNHFRNVLLALEKMRERGLKRIGLVSLSGLSERLNSAHLAALAFYQSAGHFEPIPPFVYPGKAPLSGWLSGHRPDAILTTYPVANSSATIRKLASTLPVVLVDHGGEPQFAGIDQRADDIGEAAAELLAAQMQRGDKGFPRRPQITMLEGDWIDAGI